MPRPAIHTKSTSLNNYALCFKVKLNLACDKWLAIGYLRLTVYLVITQCHELYLQGKSQQSATDLAKTFERRKCDHKEAIPGDDCLISVVGVIFLLDALTNYSSHIL